MKSIKLRFRKFCIQSLNQVTIPHRQIVAEGDQIKLWFCKFGIKSRNPVTLPPRPSDDEGDQIKSNYGFVNFESNQEIW